MSDLLASSRNGLYEPERAISALAIGENLSSRTSTASVQSGASLQSKQDSALALYCINIRGKSLTTAPDLCIRKLNASDSLYHIENANRLLTEFIAKRNEIIEKDAVMTQTQRINWIMDHEVAPDFRYVYCSQAMIRQIMNAFLHNEVSFLKTAQDTEPASPDRSSKRIVARAQHDPAAV